MDFLIKHAMANVWCEPLQDYTRVFKPYRVSPPSGTNQSLTISFYRVNAPNSGINDRTRYHIYHIGKIADHLIGLDLERNQWRNLSELMEDNRALIDVYMANGSIVPKALCYINIMSDYSVIIAVQATQVDLGTTYYSEPFTDVYSNTPYRVNSGDLYIRFYHNARFMSDNWPITAGDTSHPIRQICRKVNDAAAFSNFMAEVTSVNNNFGGIGAGLFYRDGFVESLPMGYVPSYTGRFLSYTYDDTIKSVQYHKFLTLNSFLSKLDVGKSKYLILSTMDYNTIDYQDDVDFYIVSRDTSNQIKGIFLNRYRRDAVRNVTHNAWALNADYVNALIGSHDFLSDTSRLEIMVVVRQGGLSRGLVHQYNRIEDLYRLPRDQVLQALTGANSGVPEWQAANLEKSAYCKIMRQGNLEDITKDLVVDAYGYNVVTKVAEPVIHTIDDSGNPYFNVNNALLIPDGNGDGNRAVFAYDEDRKLLHYYSNQALDVVEILPPEAADATMAEIFHAKLNELTDGTFYDQDVISTDLQFWGFRAYACPIVNGIPNERWVDVTGMNYYFYDTSDTVPKLLWNWGLLDAANLFPAVRINGTIHVYKPDMPDEEEDYDGILNFTVGAQADWFGNTVLRPQSLAPATLDVFMDGKSLIRGLDYFMKWPSFVICRRPDGPVSETEIIVRSYGCPEPASMRPYEAREFGFVKGGILSVDNRYDVRNDRNVRVNIAGSVYGREEVAFAEEEFGLTVTDGLPYIVDDYITPIEPYTERDTVVERSKTFGVDVRVSDYLTQRLAGQVPEDQTVVYERWRVFSPFLNAIIHQMLNGSMFDDQYIDFRYGNAEVENWLAPFIYLLDYDPAYLGFDELYVVVYPHQWHDPVEVTSLQFGLLKYIIRNYLFDRVELSQSVNIGI